MLPCSSMHIPFLTMYKHIQSSDEQKNLNIRKTQQLMFGVLCGVLFQERINIKVKESSSHVQAFVNPVKHLPNFE